jgi:hypothetical protein
MAAPVLCLIIPLESGGGIPTHPIAPGGPPLGIWGGAPLPTPTPPIYYPPYPSTGPGFPTHPIAPGGPPLGIWGGPPLYPDQGLPGWQPRPSHPIAPGGRPPGIWGGPPLYPDQGLPGPQPIPTPPIYLPPGTIPGAKPEHPIYIPPSIWPSPGVPTHPIVLPPPNSDGKPEVLENWDATTIWSPSSGWVVAIVPSEEHPGVPTPSK